MVVADASVLIVLAKMQRLRLLQRVYGPVTIGPVVKTEVLDQGKAVSAIGVEQIDQPLTARWIRVVSLTARERQFMRRLQRGTRLGEGEAEALALAQGRGWLLLVDDKEARAVAATLGIAYLGTAGVLLEAFFHKHLALEEFEEAVEALCRVLWISPAVVAEILRRAREAKK